MTVYLIRCTDKFILVFSFQNWENIVAADTAFVL